MERGRLARAFLAWMKLRIVPFVAALSSTAIAAAAPPIPSSFQSANAYASEPVWVSSKDVLDSTGTLRTEALSQSRAHIIDLSLANERDRRARIAQRAGTLAVDDCDVRFGAPVDDAPTLGGTPTWDLIVKSAAPYYVGTVTAEDEGLYSGIPFTVYQVRVTRTSAPASPEYVYLLYPRGSFKYKSARICTAPAGFADAPSISDRVFFVTNEAVDSAGILFRIGADRLFVEHGGKLLRPRHLENDAELRDVVSAEMLATLFSRSAANLHRHQ
jgi:hypothetical protein